MPHWFTTFLFFLVWTTMTSQQAAGYLRDDELDVMLPGIDWQVLRSLRENGDNPDCLRDVDHFLYPREGETIDRQGLIAEIAKLPGWSFHDALENGFRIVVQATTTALSIAMQIETVTRLGSGHGYEYDGWGATATPHCSSS